MPVRPSTMRKRCYSPLLILVSILILQMCHNSINTIIGVQGFTPSLPVSSSTSTTMLYAGKGFGNTDDDQKGSSGNDSTGSMETTPEGSSSGSTTGLDPQPANYEYREMSLLFRAMRSQNVKSTQLTQDKRQELEGYVRRIVQRPPTTTGGKIIPLYKIVDYLPGTSWELAFASSPMSLMNGLPKDTSIQLDFYENGELDYKLEFPKTFGLKRLTAKSSYIVDVSEISMTFCFVFSI